MEFQTVIGLEIHVELSTESKMFCGCSTEFGGEPNTRTCPVCLGHPGSLPVANRDAVAYSIMLALALELLYHPEVRVPPEELLLPRHAEELPDFTVRHTAFQCRTRSMSTWTATRASVGITRVHLEEDTGKSIHVGESGRIHGAEHSLEDFNRAGIPLAEIVTEPDIRSPEEARAFMQLLRATLEYLEHKRLQDGGGLPPLRREHLRRCRRHELGTKVEIKNMNSFRSLFRALKYEEERQREVLSGGGEVAQETRHWDEGAGRTHPLRSQGGGVRLPVLPGAGPGARRARRCLGRGASAPNYPSFPGSG